MGLMGEGGVINEYELLLKLLHLMVRESKGDMIMLSYKKLVNFSERHGLSYPSSDTFHRLMRAFKVKEGDKFYRGKKKRYLLRKGNRLWRLIQNPSPSSINELKKILGGR